MTPNADVLRQNKDSSYIIIFALLSKRRALVTIPSTEHPAQCSSNESNMYSNDIASQQLRYWHNTIVEQKCSESFGITALLMIFSDNLGLRVARSFGLLPLIFQVLESWHMISTGEGSSKSTKYINLSKILNHIKSFFVRLVEGFITGKKVNSLHYNHA